MKAIVKRVVDGDTLILDIYLGVKVSTVPTEPLGMDYYIDPEGQLVIGKVRARLHNLYAAEISTPEGIAARDRLAIALPVGTEVVLQLHGRDKYGRWVVSPMLGAVDICLSMSQQDGVPQGRGVKKACSPSESPAP